MATVRIRVPIGCSLWAAGVRGALEYRVDFLLMTLMGLVRQGVGMALMWVILARFETIAGWTLGEVAFLYGLGGIAFGISDMLSGGFDRLSIMIQSGSFDRVLTRPLGTFQQMLAGDFEMRRLGRIAQGAIALGLALTWVEIDWTPIKLLVALSAVLSGVVIFCAIWVIGAAVTFWTVQTSEVTNVFTYGGSALVENPMSIYGDWLWRFFTFIVPLAFITYLPALYILDRPDPLGLPRAFQFGSPLVAAIFFLVARAVWSFGVRHYQSTGS
jgi:ABC-2 type transport system permease protein